jgi:hypothetical protein
MHRFILVLLQRTGIFASNNKSGKVFVVNHFLFPILPLNVMKITHHCHPQL